MYNVRGHSPLLTTIDSVIRPNVVMYSKYCCRQLTSHVHVLNGYDTHLILYVDRLCEVYTNLLYCAVSGKQCDCANIVWIVSETKTV